MKRLTLRGMYVHVWELPVMRDICIDLEHKCSNSLRDWYMLLSTVLIINLCCGRYRNTYEHNLCLDMLKEGFHQSFQELFNLMEKQKQDIKSLGADSGLSDQPLLEDQPEKLDQLKYHLTTAEAAKRRGELQICDVLISTTGIDIMKIWN